jgi:hypothetical protein
MKLKQTLLVPALAVVFAASAYAQNSSNDLPDAPAATAAALTRPNGPTVVMDTSMGRITCQFYQRQAPRAVANFIALAEGAKDWTNPTTKTVEHHKPYYNGTIFHRVIPDFMIQGGDPTGTGTGDPGFAFRDEFDPNLNFDRPGRLASQLRPQHQRQPVLYHRAGLRLAQPALHPLRPVRRCQRRGRQGHRRRFARWQRQAAGAGGAEKSDHRARGPAVAARAGRRSQTLTSL